MLKILAALAAVGAAVGAAIGFQKSRNVDTLAHEPIRPKPDASVSRKPRTYETIFEDYGGQYGVSAFLAKAHAIAESSLNPYAYNKEGSSGLMQILLPIEKNKGALRHFRAGRLPEWEGVNASIGGHIFDADYNVMLGMSLMRENIRAYGLPRAIAVYNNDAATRSELNGPFPNQIYVDRVLRYYDQLRGTNT